MFLIDPSLPVYQDKDYDPGPDRCKKQEKLDAFKERFSKDQMPAYFNETTLQAKVFASLNKWRAEREQGIEGKPSTASSPKTVPAPLRDPELDQEIKTYCQKAEALHSTLPVAGFVTQLKVSIDIEDIFVPLRAMLDLSGVDGKRFLGADHAEEYLRRSDSCLEISLLEAFRQSEQRGQKGLVILGDPGSGKTTHLKRLLLWCLHKGPETLHLPAGGNQEKS